VAISLTAAVALLGACGGSSGHAGAHDTSTTAGRPLPRVEIFGDSLTVQADGALVALGRAHGLDVSVTAYFGLAPCDYAPLVRRAIATRPAALVLAFSGNNLTPCMRKNGRPLAGAAYYAKYGTDLAALLSSAAQQAVPVALVAPPVFPAAKDVPPRAPLVAEYARLVSGHDRVTLVETAAALGGPAYRTSLPCLPMETAALGCRDGRIVVRDAASPIHFDEPRAVACPTSSGHCAYSAGAHRYAVAILAGLARVLPERTAAADAAIPVVTSGKG
jgi:hypothetical protein